MIDPQQSEKISKLINSMQLDPGSDPKSQLIRPYVALNCLPIVWDSGGLFALRPNGDVVSIQWDQPESIQVISESRIRNTVLYSASCKFTELASLAPRRPESSKICPHCKGTGALQPPYDKVVCYCGGLGWLEN